MKISMIAVLVLITAVTLFYIISVRINYKYSLDNCAYKGYSGAGGFDLCMENYLLQNSKLSYKQYKNAKKLCAHLYHNEYDKSKCVDKFMFY